MKHRGRECESSRPFSNAKGTGTEWLLDGEVVYQEYATRVISAEEAAKAARFAEASAKEEARAAELAAIAAKAAAGTDTAVDRERALKLMLAAPTVARATQEAGVK